MGRILQINVKARPDGGAGLPKYPVPKARIDTDGVEGDFNRYRREKLAGDRDSAVLVVPNETLEELAREGWPIRAGDLGENLTTEGIAYDSMGPGRRLRAGEVDLVITRACEPCTNLYELPFVGPAKGPAFLKAMIGRRGWYARVTRPGIVQVGDRIDLVASGTTDPG